MSLNADSCCVVSLFYWVSRPKEPTSENFVFGQLQVLLVVTVFSNAYFYCFWMSNRGICT